MCTYYYLHRHHTLTCKDDIDYVLQYSYCSYAGHDPSTGMPAPCASVYFDADQSVDYNNPCAMGTCTVNPGCVSGMCRLAELNGVWVCCKCRRGGNQHSWCGHRMRSSPDTFCYHVCCKNCLPDDIGMGSVDINVPITTSVEY